MYFPSTSRLVFVRWCGFVSLMLALLRPSSCGPVALLHCPSASAVSFFDRCGFVSLLTAFSRPSSCGPVALLPCPSVLTVSFFVRRSGFVSLLPALSRPSPCGPVSLLHCPSVPAVSFLIVGVDSCRSCPPYRVRRPVAPWPYYLVPPYRRLVFVRRCGFVSLLPALSRPSSCGPVAFLICPSVPPVFPLSSSRVLL